jgi:DNA-binding GntR family transcriptional regulator
MTIFEPEGRRASAADESYLRLRAMLVQGEFAAGARLPEAELSARLGVSRTPLREALRRLQGDGLVTLTGRGAVVSQASTSEFEDLYRYRALLESFAAELVTERNNNGELAPIQLDRLQQLRRDVERSPDATSTSIANLELHRYIASLSGNRFLIDALSRVWDIIAISSAENIGDDPEWRSTINDHHREIVTAIVEGDTEGARRAARNHVAAAAAVHKHQRAEKVQDA